MNSKSTSFSLHTHFIFYSFWGEYSLDSVILIHNYKLEPWFYKHLSLAWDGHSKCYSCFWLKEMSSSFHSQDLQPAFPLGWKKHLPPFLSIHLRIFLFPRRFFTDLVLKNERSIFSLPVSKYQTKRRVGKNQTRSCSLLLVSMDLIFSPIAEYKKGVGANEWPRYIWVD